MIRDVTPDELGRMLEALQGAGKTGRESRPPDDAGPMIARGWICRHAARRQVVLQIRA